LDQITGTELESEVPSHTQNDSRRAADVGDVDAPRREYAHHVLYKNKPGAAERGPVIQQIESAL